jgi:transposase-like protein
MIDYRLPSVGQEVKLDRVCPDCGRKNGQIHTAVRRRAIRDLRESAIAQRRLRCPWFGTTWTVRADGVGAGRHRSDRVRGLGVMLYMFGLSYRSAVVVLNSLECGSKA